MQNLLCTAEASKFLGISQATLISYTKAGQITGSFIGRAWKYRLDDLQNFIDATRRSS
jgi:excisionase family DNA binding protein